MAKARVGIIGGSGVYDPRLLEKAEKVDVKTPYGKPSDSITVGVYEGVKVAILPRHGAGHKLGPGDINYRANIWALKELGVERILASSSAGSLREDIKPGEFVFTDQFIDRTWGRKNTFHEDCVCHISVAEPMCQQLRKLGIHRAGELGLPHHKAGTYVCIEGPRFSTKAESMMFRGWGADVIGMTLVPEAVLAREAEICYINIAMVTDYDVWKDSHVSIEEILKTMKLNIEKVRKLLTDVIPRIPKKRVCECGSALKGALV